MVGVGGSNPLAPTKQVFEHGLSILAMKNKESTRASG